MFKELEWQVKELGLFNMFLIGLLTLLALWALVYTVQLLFFTSTNFVGNGEVVFTSYKPSSSTIMLVPAYNGKSTSLEPGVAYSPEEKTIMVNMKGKIYEVNADDQIFFTTIIGDTVKLYEVKGKLIPVSYGYRIKKEQ